MKRLPIIYLITLVLQSVTHAAVVVGTSHMTDNYTGPNTFTIDQEFASSDGSGFRDFTGFIFTSLGGNSFEYGGSFLDEGASVFFVNTNDAFSEANILGSGFPELSVGTTYELPANFFLGVRTPSVDVAVPNPPAYGWAEIQNLGAGELTLVDHAVAYSGQGIFVNTVTPIPEPGTLSLGSVALVLLSKRRRRSNRGGGRF